MFGWFRKKATVDLGEVFAQFAADEIENFERNTRQEWRERFSKHPLDATTFSAIDEFAAWCFHQIIPGTTYVRRLPAQEQWRLILRAIDQADTYRQFEFLPAVEKLAIMYHGFSLPPPRPSARR